MVLIASPIFEVDGKFLPHHGYVSRKRLTLCSEILRDEGEIDVGDALINGENALVWRG
jgi:hypothetical protein